MNDHPLKSMMMCHSIKITVLFVYYYLKIVFQLGKFWMRWRVGRNWF